MKLWLAIVCLFSGHFDDGDGLCAWDGDTYSPIEKIGQWQPVQPPLA